MMKLLCFAVLVFIPLIYCDEAELWKTLDKKLESYDTRIRPGSKDTPVQVACSMYIIRFYDYNEETHSMKLDAYFRQKWNDSRLEISSNPEDSLSTGGCILKKIWKPDTFFASAVNEQFHTVPIDNTFVKISHNGEVFMSHRINMEVFCQPIQKEWPRTCPIQIESYGFSEKDIRYSWRVKNGTATNAVSHAEEGFLNHEYKKVSMDLIVKTIELSSGNYSTLVVDVGVDKD